MKPFCEENRNFGVRYLRHKFNGAMNYYTSCGDAGAIVEYCTRFGDYVIDTIGDLRKDITNLVIYLHKDDEWRSDIPQIGTACIIEYIPYYGNKEARVDLCVATRIYSSGNALLYGVDDGAILGKVLRWKPITALDIAEEYCTSTNNGTK